MTCKQIFSCLAIGCVAIGCVAIAPAFGEEASSMPEVPAFNELIVELEPAGLSPFGQREELKIGSRGICWYKVDARDAGRTAAVFQHELSSERVGRLNRLLKATDWLQAAGAEGPATHTDAATITIELKHKDGESKVVCHGQRPAPYAALLNELQGLALQERRVYLHDYVSGEKGNHAWADIGREVAALRGDSYQKSPFNIDYPRYLPIARRIVRRFYGESEDALVPAVRLIGQFRAKSELTFLHRMAHDRNYKVRHEVAWALGRIHDDRSLPVLVDMMSQGGEVEVGLELIQWGEAAVPEIVALIEQSTDDRLEPRENTIGEKMIRAYLNNWSAVTQPVDARVVAAVRESLDRKDPANGRIRTTYHQEFLKQAAKK